MNPVEVGLHEIDARNSLVADHAALLGGAQKDEILVGSH
jgi:hypothetical protein